MNKKVVIYKILNAIPELKKMIEEKEARKEEKENKK